jgi:7,8-dihydropterin-6-yl-methyl-4-(beta-D-ribofuranosyl)aminobenzene 5'-phosphate synthase
MINTIHHAQSVTGMEKVHMVVGGTHLVNASDYQMESTIRELKKIAVDRVGVSHCTGLESSTKLAAGLGMISSSSTTLATLSPCRRTASLREAS